MVRYGHFFPGGAPSVYSFLPHRHHAADAVPIALIMQNVAEAASFLGSGSREIWANKTSPIDCGAVGHLTTQKVFVIWIGLLGA